MAKRDKFGDTRPVRHTSDAIGSYSNAVPMRGRKRSGRIAARILTWALVVGLTLGIVMVAFGSFQSWKYNKQLNFQLSETYNPSFRTKYDDLGRQIVVNWFEGKEAPISQSTNVKWTTMNGQPSPSLEDFKQREGTPIIRDVAYMGGYQDNIKLAPSTLKDMDPAFSKSLVEVLNYYVVYNGVPYRASISLIIPKGSDLQPVLATSPSLEPLQIPETVEVRNDPAGLGLEKAKLPNVAIDAIQGWSSAWASNDSNTLKQITKDSTDAVYRGLGGWSAEDAPTVNWSYNVVVNGQRLVVAQVEFDIKQSVIPPRDPEATSNDEPQPKQFIIRQTQDLLLSDTETGLPSIVAWGPAGSWSKLVPLYNALPAGTAVGDKINGDAGAKGKANNEEEEESGEADPQVPGIDTIEDEG